MGSSPTLGENFLCSKKQYFANPIDGDLKSKLKKPVQFFYILYNKKQFNRKFRKKDDHYQTQSLGYHHTARLTQSLEHGILPPRVVDSSPTLGENFFIMFKKQYFSNPNDGELKSKLQKPFQFFYILYNKKQFNRKFRKKDDHYQTQSLGYHHTARLTQSLEHGILPPRVVGSSPTLGENFL